MNEGNGNVVEKVVRHGLSFVLRLALILGGCCLAYSARTAESGAFLQDEFFVGCNYWASHAGVYMWRDWRPEQIEKDLDRLASCGMTVVRVFPLWPDCPAAHG